MNRLATAWRHFPVWCFALFLTAGFFKGEGGLAILPVDLTLLTGALTGLFCLVAFWRGGFRFPSGIGWIALLWLAFLVPVLWTGWTAYGSEKVFKLFTLTLLAAVAPFFLLRTRSAVMSLAWAMAAVGLAMTAAGTWSLLSGGFEASRLTAFGSNTIALGRGAGLAFVCLTLLALERRIPLWPTLPVLGLAGLIMLASGSRGPLLVTGGLLVLMGLWFYRRRLASVAVALAVVGGAVGFGLAAYPDLLPKASIVRVQSFFSGDLGNSELNRMDFYAESWQAIPQAPMGIGWGGFALLFGGGGQEREYPHNHFLELFLEGGWAAGALALGLYAAACRRYTAAGLDAGGRVVMAVFLFSLANAMVSGDVNDNKLLFALLALGLGPGLLPRRRFVRAPAAWRVMPGALARRPGAARRRSAASGLPQPS